MMYKSVKIVILGDASIGKTSIINKYIFNKNDIKTSTLGAVFIQLNHKFKGSDGTEIILPIQYWDTAGQERYNALMPMYIRDADFTILAFDLTNFMSFLNLNKWLKISKQNVKKTKYLIMGCKSDIYKSDIHKQYSEEEVEKFIAENIPNSKYFRTSYITGENIDNVFSYIKKELEELGEIRNKLNSLKFNSRITLEKNNYIGHTFKKYCFN